MRALLFIGYLLHCSLKINNRRSNKCGKLTKLYGGSLVNLGKEID